MDSHHLHLAGFHRRFPGTTVSTDLSIIHGRKFPQHALT
jgi:hypothetical protein